MQTAMYLINRSRSEAIDKTPIEKWTNKKANLRKLQIFGTTAYVKSLGYERKLDPRCEKYIFIGYATNGYRLWDESNKKIIIARDVVFDNPVDKVQVKIELPKDEKKSAANEENRISETETETEDNNAESEETESTSTTEEMPIRKNKRNVKLPEKFKDYVLLTYQEAVSGPDKKYWIKAIEEEKTL